jgi:hypothetical protein
MKKYMFFIAALIVACTSRRNIHDDTYNFIYPENICIPDSLGGKNIHGFIYYRMIIHRKEKIRYYDVIAFKGVIEGDSIYTTVYDNPEFMKRWDAWLSSYISSIQLSDGYIPRKGAILGNTLRLDSVCREK